MLTITFWATSSAWWRSRNSCIAAARTTGIFTEWRVSNADTSPIETLSSRSSADNDAKSVLIAPLASGVGIDKGPRGSANRPATADTNDDWRPPLTGPGAAIASLEVRCIARSSHGQDRSDLRNVQRRNPARPRVARLMKPFVSCAWTWAIAAFHSPSP